MNGEIAHRVTNEMKTTMLDGEKLYEKDLKVDKKIMQIMLAGGNEQYPSFYNFLTSILFRVNVNIKMADSLKDRQGNEIPVLRVKSREIKNIEIASALIMQQLDPHRDKMTFNIDVPFNDHSYIIGKDGSRIKQLSSSTGCHIHLPDCNKMGNKKSNKLSIAGTNFYSIDQARDKIRKSLPLNIGFKAPIKPGKFVVVDTACAEVQAVKRKHRVDVTFTNVIENDQHHEVTINVKGGRSQMEEIQKAAKELYEFVTGKPMSDVLFFITIDISHVHHQYVKGKNQCNLKVINQRSGANIVFPPHDSVSNQVQIISNNILFTIMGWQELMGYLPLLLSFDVNFDISKYQPQIQKLEKEYGVSIRIREKLSGHVSTILIKTQERHSTYLEELRNKILELKNQNENRVPGENSLVRYIPGNIVFTSPIIDQNDTKIIDASSPTFSGSCSPFSDQTWNDLNHFPPMIDNGYGSGNGTNENISVGDNWHVKFLVPKMYQPVDPIEKQTWDCTEKLLSEILFDKHDGPKRYVPYPCWQ